MKSIIQVENLSKQYRIGSGQVSYSTVREAILGALKTPFKRIRGRVSSNSETVWALKDLSFEIKPGEVVGIVGRNGAGKSTLLKVLSHITEPTTGRVKLYGRVGSLLEVGTGFHPELTGRENIYLNGAILGMKRTEIKRNFDEIVAFSEIEQFIDTPVKWYSSGMYLRLAFSVAAHLNPEVLIMDEVLAVGDYSFQFKCLDKMQSIRQQGRTILFVSHNMPAVTRLCERVILMNKGSIISDGPTDKVVSDYLSTDRKISAEQKWHNLYEAPGNEIVRLLQVRVRTENGQTISAADIRRPVGIELTYQVLQPNVLLVPNYHFFNEDGLQIFALQDVNSDWRSRPRPIGEYVSTAWIPGNFLSEGSIVVDVAVSSHIPATVVHAYERSVIAFQVIDSLDGDSARGDYTGPMFGVVRPVVEWTTQFSTGNKDRSLEKEKFTALSNMSEV